MARRVPLSRKVLAGCLWGLCGATYVSTSRSEYIWEHFTMPVIRLLDAEQAHRLAVMLASFPLKPLVPSFPTKTEDTALLHTQVWGVSFPAPIGLAAGFDKHAQCMQGMLKMGFGFVEIGSVTPLPQVGNAKPRNFRLIEDDGHQSLRFQQLWSCLR